VGNLQLRARLGRGGTNHDAWALKKQVRAKNEGTYRKEAKLSKLAWVFTAPLVEKSH